jgi:nucleoid DNA-binding protein
MVKNEFIAAIKDTEVCADVSKKDIEAVIKGMSEVLLDVIAKNDAVKVGSVVTIGGKHRDERVGHNPATGEKLTIAARDGVPYAKFSSVAKA